MKKIPFFVFLILLIIGIILLIRLRKSEAPVSSETNTAATVVNYNQNPLSISFMRIKRYEGSPFVIEETLPDGSNYHRYIVSYLSEGLKIHALLTVPLGEKPTSGWPVIIFNHGYIPPKEYRTTERYIAYTDAFSRNGYIVLKSDYRGNGASEGKPNYPEYSPDYTIDILNAIGSIKQFKDADSNRIGMWGHSMGGAVTFRSMIVSNDIKAVEIWAGVVGSYDDLVAYHSRRRQMNQTPFPSPGSGRQNGRQALIDTYGTIAQNPTFWNAIDPLSYISDITIPIQIQHGTADEEVPYALSVTLVDLLKKANKNVTFYSYEGDNHNISNNVNVALNRSVSFFDTYLK